MAFCHYLFSLLASLAIPQVVFAESFSLALSRKSCSGIQLPPRLRHHRGTAQVGEINQQEFWFANFTVGAKNDLVLLIDTGSTDVYLNPGIYEASREWNNLNDNFTITFATTNSDGSGTETISGPIYEDVVALDNTQLSVPQQPLGVVASPLSPTSFPNDGLVGFGGLDDSTLKSSSWFQHLCSQGSLDSCRFGLAFKTDDTGVQYFGDVATERFAGPLNVAPLFLDSYGEELWVLYGDVAAGDKVVERDALIFTDSGTTVIFGPVDAVQTLFDAAGIQSVLTTVNGSRTLNGYYPCDHPPELGFGFPSISNATTARSDPTSPVSHWSTIFNVLPSQLAENSTSGNCTAVIHGTDDYNDIWIVGQAFFQGRYIDHNVDDYTMGFANLLDC